MIKREVILLTLAMFFVAVVFSAIPVYSPASPNVYSEDKISENLRVGLIPYGGAPATIFSNVTAWSSNGTITNPTLAYNNNLADFAQFGWSSPYGVRYWNLSSLTWVPPGEYRLAGINITMKYYALPVTNAQYKIVAAVGGKSTELVGWTIVPRSTSTPRVFNDVREPNDGLWTQSEIQNLKITTLIRNTTAAPSITFRNYETWVSFPSGRVVFGVHVNDVFDLFAWQFRMGFPGNTFDVKRVAQGAFLREAAEAQGSTTTFVVKMYNGPTGNYTLVSDVMMAPATRGVDGNGTLAWVELEVQGYNATIMDLYDTQLADSFNNPIVHTTADGYFKNKLNGDSNGDKIVNVLDMGALSASWTGVVGALPYSRDTDNNDDDVINVLDMGITSANWGRTSP